MSVAVPRTSGHEHQQQSLAGAPPYVVQLLEDCAARKCCLNLVVAGHHSGRTYEQPNKIESSPVLVVVLAF